MEISEDQIVNKVAQSQLISIDLEDWYQDGERVLIDIKFQLYEELILKEKDFRKYIKDTDWSYYKDKWVAITCSADAIVPTWAYMLLVSALSPYAKLIVYGNLEELENVIWLNKLNTIDFNQYRDKKLVIKGCGKKYIPTSAYIEFTRRAMPVASSIMYGEPCSTVPVYKKK
jgi:hypothetical protein